MDRNARLFYRSALALKLPVIFNEPFNALDIYLGKTHYYFCYTKTPFNYGASTFAAANKFVANKLLEEAGFKVPKATAFTKEDWQSKPLAELVQDLDFPVVAKPMRDTVRGFGVLCNIKNSNSLSEHLPDFFSQFNTVQVEEFHQNLKEYRVLILKKAVIGVVERFGASVIGDGIHSIEELIALKNEEKKRQSQSITISPLIYDKEYKNCLEEQGLSLQDIPDYQHKVRLCYTVNTGRGGDIFSLGKTIHPENRKRLVKAAQTLGLNYVGFDLLCEDINRPFSQSKWLIIEANFFPDITIHEIPPYGQKTPVASKILRQLIWRHPFSYLSFIFSRIIKAFYFRCGLALGLLITAIIRLS